MSTTKLASSSHFLGSLILIAAMFFSLGAPWPVCAQTSETSTTATEQSEPGAQSKTKDASKTKYAAVSYSVDQVPDDAVPGKSKNEENRILRELNARLKAENAQLKAEIAKLKAKE
jgi:hypothetical protein